MAVPKIHSVHFDASDALLSFIGKKMEKLETLHDKIVGSEVFLRLDGSDSGDNKVAEIKLNIPGKELFAKKQCKSFEEATDLAVEALKKQIQRHKEKY